MKSEEVPVILSFAPLKTQDDTMEHDTLEIKYNDLLRREQERKEHNASVMREYNALKQAGDMMSTLSKKIISLNYLVNELKYKIENNKVKYFVHEGLRIHVENGVSYYKSMNKYLLELNLTYLSFDIEYHKDVFEYLSELLRKSSSLLENAKYKWVKTENIVEAYESLAGASKFVHGLGCELRQIYQSFLLDEIK